MNKQIWRGAVEISKETTRFSSKNRNAVTKKRFRISSSLSGELVLVHHVRMYFSALQASSSKIHVKRTRCDESLNIKVQVLVTRGTV